MSWTEGPLLAFDTETTGVDPTQDHVVTISLVRVDNGSPVWARGAVVNCGVEVPDGAAAIHGFTTERVQAEGREPYDVLPKVLEVMHREFAEGVPLVAMNAKFDWTILHCECDRIEESDIPEFNIIDPLVIDRHVDKWRKGRRTLTHLAEHYGVELLAAHTASADALAGAQIARAIGRTFPEVGDMDPLELHQAQVVWFKEWAASFSEYLAKKGEPPVDESWPL